MMTGTMRTLVTLLATTIAAVVLSGCGKKEAAPLTEPAAANIKTSAPPDITSNQGFERLKGRWFRPDGGYVLEIRSVTADGKLEAGYFNPQPINVASAEVTRHGSAFQVFVELRDVNYPGSTYTLIYQPATDRLFGTYFQAAMNQSFEVEFVRQP